MAISIANVSEALYAELTKSDSKVKNPYNNIMECTEAVRHARCKADHPQVWGTTIHKALLFHGFDVVDPKKEAKAAKKAEALADKSESVKEDTKPAKKGLTKKS